MVAIATELIGRSADQNNDGNVTRERHWFVRGAESEADAIAAVAALAPSLLDGLPLTHVSIKEVVRDGYECAANYASVKPLPPLAPLEVGQSSFHFEIATQSTRIVHPITPQLAYIREGFEGSEESPVLKPDWLIGQQGDGSPPEGVEAPEPIASFAETHVFGPGVITAEQQRVLLRVVGHLNQSTFRGWQAQEVLCTGISGSQRGGGDWEISFRFAVREHQTGLTICGIENIDKKGWQYIWPKYAIRKEDKTLSNFVYAIVVADVHRIANYSVLGIGS